jgi:hypothetical protein
MRDEEKTKDQLIAELLEARDKLSKMAMFAMERGLASARVRAEAVAMRSSDDLMNVVGTVFREIKHLGMDIHIATISVRFSRVAEQRHRPILESFCALRIRYRVMRGSGERR